MKIKYSPDVDILTISFSETPVDYAEESEGVITHFSVDGKPVMLEIQGGRDFLLGLLPAWSRDPMMERR